MANSRYIHALGNGRYLQVCEWKGALKVDLREWQDSVPTKKGISLSLSRWKSLVDAIETIDQTLKDKRDYESHLGGNVYCRVQQDNPCVDIRQHWKPENEVIATKKGICLRPLEYKRLKEVLPEIDQALPELYAVVPCHLQSDHMNQMIALQCSECNPNDYMNW